MKKILIFLLFIITCQQYVIANNDIQSPPLSIDKCSDQIPYGMPKSNKNGIIICRNAYITENDTKAKLPIWVSYKLTSEHTTGCIKRTNAFAVDNSLPKGSRAELSDYTKSGYDMGHMANDGDMSYNPLVEHESFILSNMSPQTGTINRISFRQLESIIRAWVEQVKHPFLIYVGPLYNSSDKTIGKNKVVVPHGFYKIVIDMETNEYAAWIFPNEGKVDDLNKIRATITSIEKESNIIFPLPVKSYELPLNKNWIMPSLGQFTKDKQQVCGVSNENK